MYAFLLALHKECHNRKGLFRMIITKDTIIGDILDADAEAAAPFFFEMGMHCLGCPASRGETVEEQPAETEPAEDAAAAENGPTTEE